MDPPCTAAPAWLPYTSIFPSLVVATQYQPGLVRFTPVEAKAPFLKLVPSGPLKVELLPFTTLIHLALADFEADGTTDVAVLDGISMKIGVYVGERAKPLPAIPAQGCVARPPDHSLDLEGRDPYFLGTGDFDRDGLRKDRKLASSRWYNLPYTPCSHQRGLPEGGIAVSFPGGSHP